MKSSRIIPRLLLLLPVFLLLGCDMDTIAEVKSDPYKFENKEARLGGIVRRHFGVLNYGLYEIEDRTGSIFVVSQRGVPSEGTRVEVKGTALNAFSLAGTNYGTVIQETSRKIHD